MFHRKDHLKNHLHTHDPNKEAFSCDECGKSYNTKLGFRRHQALHSANAGDLTCRVCLQTFPSTAELLEHLKSHAGKSSGGAKEKKHQCEHCDRRFYTRKDVRRHMVVHTGRKDFLCQYCAQRFGRKDHLTRHVKKSHTKELLKVKTEPLDLLDPFACGVPLPVKAELQSMMAMASGELGVYASPAQVDQAAGPLAMACPLEVEHAGLSAHQHPLKYQPGSTSYSMPGSEKEQPLKGEIESYLMELQNSMPSSSGGVAIPGAKLGLTSPVGALDEASVDASLSKLHGMAASDPLPSSSSSLDFSQLFNFLPLNGPPYGQPIPGSGLGIGYIQEEALSLPQPQDPSEPGGSVGLGALHGLSSPFTSNTGATTLPRFHQAFQ